MPAKKKKALLGVADPKIGAAILEELGYQCQTGGVVAELLRGELGTGVGGPAAVFGHHGDGDSLAQGSACTSRRW